MATSALVTGVQDVPRLGHREAMALAETEYRRFAALLDELTTEEWAAPTECTPWTVRDMATHVLGYMRACCSIREQVRQVWAAKRRGGPIADALSALQVEQLADMAPAAIAAEANGRVSRATRGRRTTPWPVRHLVRVTSDLPVSGRRERWPLGYLVDIIGTRDTWMHRLDICRATGRLPDLSSEHDGRIVADIVAEWGRRHGRPFELVLSGTAGGAYRSGTGGPTLHSDALDFCRALCGRGDSVPFDTEVPF